MGDAGVFPSAGLVMFGDLAPSSAGTASCGWIEEGKSGTGGANAREEPFAVLLKSSAQARGISTTGGTKFRPWMVIVLLRSRVVSIVSCFVLV